MATPLSDFEPSRPRTHWSVWLWLATITLSGGLFRLYRLGSVPPGLHYDEAVYGLQALDILNGLRPVFFASYTGREPLYMYLMAVIFRVVGPGELGIRLTSALAGIATIPLVFLTFRELLMDRSSANRLGLLAAAYVAFSYWSGQALLISLMVGLTLQMMVVALLLVHRSS